MNKRQGVQIRSIKEGLRTLGRLPENRECTELRRLRDALADRSRNIDALLQRQHNADRKRSTPSKVIDAARRALRTRHLIPVSRRARRLFKHEPTILRALRLPPTRGTPEAHAASALAMAKALRPHAKFCHAEGFRQGFITELKAAGTQLRALATGTAAAKEEMTLVTRQLQDAIRDARELASIIDVEIAAIDHENPKMAAKEWGFSTLAEMWSNAHKLGKTMGRPKRKKAHGGPAPG